MSSNQHSSHDMHFIQHGATSFYLNKRSGTQFYDRKPMRSIILHKNFHEDQ